MPRKAEKKSAELRAGIFIIITIALLIFSILWLRYFAVTPEMTIAAKFNNPGPVSRGLPVYFQGVNVGEVSKVGFSDNFKYTYVYIDIYQKNLRIPANVIAAVRTEGITGQKYIDILYPANPVSSILSDGDVISGKSPFGLDEIQAYFEQQIKSGRMDRILTNLEETMANANEMSVRLDSMSVALFSLLQANKDEINAFFKNGSLAAEDISTITANIRDFLGAPSTRGNLRTTINATAEAADSIRELLTDEEMRGNVRGTVANINEASKGLNEIIKDTEIREGLRSTFGGLGRLMGRTEGVIGGSGITTEARGTLSDVGSLIRDVDKLVNNIDAYTAEVYRDIQQTCLIENASYAFFKASKTLDAATGLFGKAETSLDKISETQFDGDLKTLIVRTLQNTNQAAKQFDCLNEGLSEMLSKRFLLLRLLFGKPGAALEQCEKFEKYLDGNGKNSNTKQTMPPCQSQNSKQPCFRQKIPEINPGSKPSQPCPVR